MDTNNSNLSCQDIKTKYKDRNSLYKNFLSLILTVFSIFYFSMFLFIKIPEENVRFIDTILGFLLGSVVSVIINYYYGSSVDDIRSMNHSNKEAPSDTTTTVPNVVSTNTSISEVSKDNQLYPPKLP